MAERLMAGGFGAAGGVGVWAAPSAGSSPNAISPASQRRAGRAGDRLRTALKGRATGDSGIKVGSVVQAILGAPRAPDLPLR